MDTQEPDYIFTTREAAENMAKKLDCGGTQEFYNIDGKQSGLKANTTYYLPCSSREALHNNLAKYKKKMSKAEAIDTDEIDFPECEGPVSFDAFLRSYFTQGGDYVSDSVKKTLKKKVEDYNKNGTHKIRTSTLVTVFRRGIGAYKTNPQSVRPNVRSADQWGYGRVNGFLHALRTGSFKRKPFDTDLLPASHGLSSKGKK